MTRGTIVRAARDVIFDLILLPTSLDASDGYVWHWRLAALHYITLHFFGLRPSSIRGGLRKGGRSIWGLWAGYDDASNFFGAFLFFVFG